MTQRQLRIGVLGAGPIAQFAHLEAIRKANNAELYAICDQAEDLLARVAAVHAPRTTYSDYAAMLADSDLEAVVIATADPFHVPAARQALLAGKHVLVEKPLGVSVEECTELRDLVASSGLTLQVGHMKRFDEGLQFARRFIREELGEKLALRAWYCDSASRYTMTDALQPLPYTSDSARKPAGDPKADKRRYFMLTHGSHLVDTARFLGGEILSLEARLVQKFGAYCWFASVQFADGSVGHLDLTVAVRMDWHEGAQIYGEHGSVLIKTFLPWHFRSSEVECFSSRTGTYTRPLGADGHFFRRQLEGFADTVLNGAPMLGADAEDGLAAMRAMVAMARSAEGGGWMRLAEVEGSV
jgi:predicted dehydrogenase